MPASDFRPTLSRNLFIALSLTLLALPVAVWLLREPLAGFYIANGLTGLGLALNGVIVAFFLAGCLRLLTLLWRYMGEEYAIARFIDDLRRHGGRLAVDDDDRTLIARRYRSMLLANRQGATPDHAALAQLLVAGESSRSSLPRYVNNILILTGVFGTIVSLSIALVGTSDLLAAAGGDTSGINVVVHGMSTALSTTMTAIVCYVIFGYFYLRFTNVQTRIISAIEQITADYLMPRFRVAAEHVNEETVRLIASLKQVAERLQQAQDRQEDHEALLLKALQDHNGHMEDIAQQLLATRRLLKTGFRLSDGEVH